MCARIGSQQHPRFYQRTVRISQPNTTHAGTEEGEIEGQSVSRDNVNSTGKEISHSVHPASQPTHQSLHHLQTKPIYGTHQANQTPLRRKQSRSTTSSACSSPNARPAVSVNFLYQQLRVFVNIFFPLEAMYPCLRWK